MGTNSHNKNTVPCKNSGSNSITITYSDTTQEMIVMPISIEIVVDAGEVDVTGSSYANGSTSYDHRHNFPNILFNAFDVVNVSMFCDAAASETRMNSNACA